MPYLLETIIVLLPISIVCLIVLYICCFYTDMSKIPGAEPVPLQNPYGISETFQVREVKIALIGMTGSGKSSFIKTVFEELNVNVYNPESW
jgi:hypothetical protein